MGFEELTQKVYKTLTENVCKNSPLKDDLHAEAIMVIYEKQYVFEEIRNLKYFFAKVVWLTWHSDKFKQKYISKCLPMDRKTDVEQPEDKQITYFEIFKMINENYANQFEYYEKNIIRLYIELGDCRAISKQTGIPYRTLTNDIKQLKDKLRKLHYEENSN